MSTASISRRTPPWSAGSSRSRWRTQPGASLEILKGLRERYEKHHKLQITDEALEAAVSLSARYINDRFLPDKAID